MTPTLSIARLASYLIVAVSSAAFGAWATSNAYEADVATIRANYDEAQRAAEEASRRLEQKYASAARAADVYYGDLQNERRKASDLADSLAGINRDIIRVRVPAKCTPTAPDTGPTAVDHGTQTAELDPAFATALARITADGDAAIVQLTALQAYVSSLQAAQQEGATDGKH